MLLHFPIGWRRCRIGKVKEKRGHACALRCAHDSAVGFSSWPLKTAAGFALEVPASADAVMCKRKKEKKRRPRKRETDPCRMISLCSLTHVSPEQNTKLVRGHFCMRFPLLPHPSHAGGCLFHSPFQITWNFPINSSSSLTIVCLFVFNR